MRVRLGLLFLLLSVAPAAAQNIDLNALLPAGNGAVSGRIIQLFFLITILSVAPGILVMMTSFTRLAVA